MTQHEQPQIAVLLHTTFTRWKHAIKTIESFLADERFSLYVSDTGEMTPEKMSEYDLLMCKGVNVFHLGWDTSPAITRNFLMDRITEPYVFKIDDDFLYDPEQAQIDEMLSLFEHDENIGLVGMAVESQKYESKFIFDAQREPDGDGERMHLVAPAGEERRTETGFRYRYCDVTPDCWIARRDMFPECGWDERYHVSEGLHTDFFLHIKYNTPWRVVYCPDSRMYTFKHDPAWEQSDEDRKRSFYNTKRFRNLHKSDTLKNKWNVTRINRF